MKVRILKLNDDDYEVENLTLDTNRKVVKIIEIDGKLFDILLNCEKEKRLLIINNLL
jgi:hypothetical protein